MTAEETDEFESDEYETVPIEPKRIFFTDFLVHGADFARRVFEAMVLSTGEVAEMLAAHANYQKDQHEKKETVKNFMAELDALPTASR